jgi:hypothetical protein
MHEKTLTHPFDTSKSLEDFKNVSFNQLEYNNTTNRYHETFRKNSIVRNFLLNCENKMSKIIIFPDENDTLQYILGKDLENYEIFAELVCPSMRIISLKGENPLNFFFSENCPTKVCFDFLKSQRGLTDENFYLKERFLIESEFPLCKDLPHDGNYHIKVSYRTTDYT